MGSYQTVIANELKFVIYIDINQLHLSLCQVSTRSLKENLQITKICRQLTKVFTYSSIV